MAGTAAVWRDLRHDDLGPGRDEAWCHWLWLPPPKEELLETLLFSTVSVALAEIGDKTQLLALVLAARFRKPWPIIAGCMTHRPS